jgi:hypothetical protein
MTKVCPVDSGEVFDDTHVMCFAHVRPLVSTVDQAQASPLPDGPVPQRVGVPAPEGTGGSRSWSTETCWRCGAVPPHPDNTTCLDPACGRSLIPPALHLRFPDGEVELAPGARAELGRRGPHGRAFRRHPNVSRRHAVVGADQDGRAWIEPLRTPNGTFVNGAEIPESVAKALVTGDSVRLARDVEGVVTLYDH